MNLYQLAFTCYIYDSYTTFNRTYKVLRNAVGKNLDINNPDHRKLLIEWLNKWGCRQFSLEHHQTASNEILAWSKEGHAEKLPTVKQLWELNESEFDKISYAYDALACRVASKKKRNINELTVTVGPTGASKILFALRPEYAVAWDEAIRKRLNYSGCGSSYVDYLKRVVYEIEKLDKSCIKNEIKLSDVPAILGRSDSTLPQLIGEYFWVTETRSCYPPDVNVIKTWTMWAQE